MQAIQLDENLIIRMAGGDGSAFRELYEQTASAVYGFALSILKNTHDAEDVMHDAFVKAYTAAVTYKPMGKPVAWLLTIVRNLCYNRIRAGKVCEDISEYEDFARTEHDEIEDRIVLEKAMNILGFEERQIVILHALTGLKHREIAEILELPTGTVLSKYNRALKKMKTEIEGKGEAK
jgi:RNA polymerase sigma-70 factor (ECF subfamily)